MAGTSPLMYLTLRVQTNGTAAASRGMCQRKPRLTGAGGALLLVGFGVGYAKRHQLSSLLRTGSATGSAFSKRSQTGSTDTELPPSIYISPAI